MFTYWVNLFFATKFYIWHKRLAGPGCGCVSNHHSEFYSSRRQCAGRNLFWTLNVWNGLCCLNVWQLLWGLKSWKLLLACSTIPLGIMLAWSSRWWGWWWQLRCIEDMSATTASRFDRQQALLLEVRASDVCVQSPEMCLSQKRLPPVTDCQVIGAREQSDTLQVGGGSFGLHNCLFCWLPICQTCWLFCGTYLICLSWSVLYIDMSHGQNVRRNN